MQVSLVIPALDEAESIGKVLSAISPMPDLEILVVDGGSRDATPAIASAAGARLILETRKGYGQACATGLAAAQGVVVAFLDADGADDPQHLPELVTPVLAGEFEMVLGSRLAGRIDPGAMPWHQYAGNWLAAWLIRQRYDLQITDLSPFRAVRRDALLRLGMQEITYGWPTEMIVKAARQKWRLSEVPVNYHARIGGRSKISGTFRGTLAASYFILRTIFQYSRS